MREPGAAGVDVGRAASGGALCAACADLHPLADAHQVQHILGAAAHAARAAELAHGGDPAVGGRRLEQALRRAPADVIAVLRRYPAAPGGGGRVGELLRTLDQALRVGAVPPTETSS